MRLVQLSDVHVPAADSPSRPAPGRTASALAEGLASLHPDLVVVTGDLAAHDPSSQDQAEAAASWGRSLAAELEAPLLVIPGNHDVGENGRHDEIAPDWQISFVNPESVAAFRERWGGDRFVYHPGGAPSLIGLNGQLFGSGLEEEQEQDDWLRAQVAEAPGPWVLFTHQPLRLPDGSSPERHWGLPPLKARDHLDELWAEKPPVAVVSGHIHAYSARVEGPTAHITCPSLSHTVPEEALDRLPGSLAVTGFLVHELTDQSLSHWCVEGGAAAALNGGTAGYGDPLTSSAAWTFSPATSSHRPPLPSS